MFQHCIIQYFLLKPQKKKKKTFYFGIQYVRK